MCSFIYKPPPKILPVGSFFPRFARMFFANLLFFPNPNPAHIPHIYPSIFFSGDIDIEEY